MSQFHSRNLEFSRWRAIFWPVHNHELKKLIPMLLIFFLIFFDYNVLRNLKDTLVVTAKSSGAEAIPFIKVWVMFPGAILFTFLFTRLSNRWSTEKVFYVMMSSFLLFFLIFTFILYPLREHLHFHHTADYLERVLPKGCHGWIAMLRNWTFTLFYVFSELWSNIILSMLFWGFANQVTRVSEAKRFYGLFGIGANFSGVAAGMVSVYFCSNIYNPNLPFGNNAWEQSLTMLVILVLITGLIALAIFRWMHTSNADSLYCDDNDRKIEDNKEKAPKFSMRESISYLMRSRYLFGLAVVVIAYNIVINLVEVMWKHEIKELYPNPNDYNWYMNQITTITGFLATFAAWLVSGNAMRKFGWTFTAMLTPLILLITSVGFFTFFFLKPYIIPETWPFLIASPLAIVAFFGSAQNILSRAAKYTVFDATKEMAYVPLNAESKLKGKAVIDGLGSRLGKSGGALVYQGLLITFSSITASAPCVAIVLFVVIAFWIIAVRSLGRQFAELTNPSQKAKEESKSEVFVNFQEELSKA